MRPRYDRRNVDIAVRDVHGVHVGTERKRGKVWAEMVARFAKQGRVDNLAVIIIHVQLRDDAHLVVPCAGNGLGVSGKERKIGTEGLVALSGRPFHDGRVFDKI